MGFFRNRLHKDRSKLKFITASSIIVMGVVLLTTLFNRTSLEKLYFDSYLSEFSIDAALLAGELGRLPDSTFTEKGAAIGMLLQRHRDRIHHRLTNGHGKITDTDAIEDTFLAVSRVSATGRILDSSDPSIRNKNISQPILTYLQSTRSNEKSSGHAVESRIIEGQNPAKKIVYLGCPVRTPNTGVGVYGMISLDRNMVTRALANSLGNARLSFWTAFGISILLLIVILSIVLPDHGYTPIPEQKNIYTLITCFFVTVQVFFSVLYAADYRANLLALVQREADNARTEFVYRMAYRDTTGIAAATKKDIPEKNIKDAAEQVVSARPSITGLSVTLDRKPIRKTLLILEPIPEKTGFKLFSFLYDLNRLTASSRWVVPDIGSGEMRVFPSTHFLNHMLSEMLMDSITVLVISILLFMEFMFLLKTSFARKMTRRNRKSAPVDYILMRPAAFLFLFAVDLSMSFIPLHMERVYEPMLGLSRDVVIGLPITVEFIFVGVAIFGSGYWIDRRGWHEPFIAGLVVSTMGLLYSWLATDAANFILSRGLVGVGYGLSLMASQGFVITFTDLRSKALGLAQLFAGIYAGSICGGAAGAMLADRFGFAFTFQIGAVIISGIIAYTFVFMRHAMHKPVPPTVSSTVKTEKVRFSQFIGNRIVISLILLSSLPASIAIVGFLNYFCPLYLNGLGVTQSSIGRILMIYGVSLVYFGPIIGKHTDLSNDKRIFVFAGCILGSLTFLIFYFVQGIFAAIMALLLLGLSSCFVLSSQSAYLLNLRITRNFGQGKAVGIFRSTSRLGQALGPIVFSGLILSQNLENGIIFFGLIYLLTALLFFLFTRRDNRYFIEETA